MPGNMYFSLHSELRVSARDPVLCVRQGDSARRRPLAAHLQAVPDGAALNAASAGAAARAQSRRAGRQRDARGRRP